ncbi:MAG TPA: translation initiation factor IF-2 [Actinomycetota bacterium]|nr:translation initiation factor IF-2 [Actinomycetota bacterium]
MRIHELAKELGTKSKDLVESLEQMGYAGLTASSSVPDEAVPRLRASGGKAVPAGKPKVVTEEPLPTRRRPRAPTAEAPTAAPEAQAGGGDGQAGPPAAPEAAVPEPAPPEPERETIRVPRGATVKDLAERLGVEATALIKQLFEAGEMVTITQSLSDDAIAMLVRQHGAETELVAPDEDEEPELEEEEIDPARLRPRPPVVTVMGHVDHGKTLLLDAIRQSDVVAGEAGGITQHIGAYQVHQNGNLVTFIDTPGHEAFTAMRARGAQVTDIAVLVVAADDGVMPQTVEAIDHARAAGVPIVVAVNKVDKPEADPTRVRQQLAEQGVQTSEWGGDFEFVDVSAKTGQNLDKLIETILLVAELQELKADPESAARGVAIEAHLDKGRGPVATVLIQRGTLRAGDAIVCGSAFGRVRAMLDEHGQAVEGAPPGRPVLVLGWSKVPEAGDEFRVVADEKDARHLAQEREARLRAAEQVAAKPAVRLEDVLTQVREGEVSELRVVLKADVQGSLEALADALEKLSTDEVRVRILRRGVGAVSQSDVELAKADEAIVIGFNVRPDANARDVAERENVDLRLYRVIYQAVDDIRQALSGLLAPEQREASLGEAEVRATFRVPRLGVVAGCYVTRGTLTRGARVRLVRDGTVVYEGRIASLRRFKDDVREVAEGFECGAGLENFQDIKEGDVIEAFEIREVARSL